MLLFPDLRNLNLKSILVCCPCKPASLFHEKQKVILEEGQRKT